MKRLPIFLLFFIPVLACAPSIKKEEVSVSYIILPREEQEKRSLEVFNKILEILESGPKAQVLPELEKAYLEIINNYPDAPLAQESYWRLIIIYTIDYIPSKIDEAEVLYRKFITLYPNSPFRNEIEQTLTRFYYTYKKME